MRRNLGTLIFGAWAAMAVQAASPTNSPVPLASVPCLQNATSAIVTLYAMDHRYKRVTGIAAGFLIREDGVLVTARHVSEHSDALVAVTPDGQTHRVTGYYGDDRDYDIAVVKLDGSGYPHLPLAAALLPHTDQWVVVISPETNGQFLCVTGAVQQVAGVPGIIDIINLTLPLHPGQSGSPVFNESGEVVGVASGGRIDGTGFVMPVSLVQPFLAQRGQAGPIPFAKRPRKGTSVDIVVDETFHAAARAVEQEDWPAAERLAKQTAKKFPDSAFAQMLLGLAKMKRGDWKGADAAFAAVVRLKPQSAFAWFSYSSTLVMRSRPAEAEEALQRSVALGLTAKDQLEAAWHGLAYLRAVRKDANGAREALATLQQLDPAKADNYRRDLQRAFPKLAL